MLADAPGGKPEVILIATGSEVEPRRATRTSSWSPSGIRSRVVSMPSWDIFEQQPQEYRDSVLPPDVDGARRDRAGLDVRLGALRRHAGAVIGMKTFGASAPLKALQEKFGFTAEHVVAAAKAQLRGAGRLLTFVAGPQGRFGSNSPSAYSVFCGKRSSG